MGVTTTRPVTDTGDSAGGAGEYATVTPSAGCAATVGAAVTAACTGWAHALGMADAPADPLDERVLDVLRERGPLLVAGIAKVVRRAGHYPIHAALRRLEQRALVRPAGARSEADVAAARGTVSVWEAVPTP